jgi:ATP-dependent Clp protease ATP-binding subunit ClpA
MFNRIDRIVPFLPLDEATVEKIVRRELDLVGRRDGVLLRGVAFAPDDAVVRHLATSGYDRTYGARPLKRLIERDLLVPWPTGSTHTPTTSGWRPTSPSATAD